jgi:glucose-1-phosphate adenylyltransferase
MDFREMLQNHIDKEADITIATIPVADREAPDFGILKSNAENYITSFIEKPAKELLPQWVSDTGDEMKLLGRKYLASMGIYIFNRKLLFDQLLDDKKDATDFGKEIIPSSLKQHKVLSYQYDGYWTDIGNIYSFYEANLALTLEIPPFNLFDNTKAIYSRARMLPPMKIGGTHVESSILAEGSIIHASKITNSVIGIRTRIGKETEITNSYVMGSDYYETIPEMAHSLERGIPKLGIGERCSIENAILDKDCRIGDDVNIKGGAHLADTDHSLYTVKDGIVVIKKGAVLPNGFVI